MIIYLQTKERFNNDVMDNDIEDKIVTAYKNVTGKNVGANEKLSWKNSLRFMHGILTDAAIPMNAGVAIEFHLPLSAKRIDFMITGKSKDLQKTAIIIELKQWERVEVTTKDAIVKTFVGGKVGEHTHPSYQAWSYATILQDFNQVVTSDSILLKPCAYLHNCVTRDTINHPHYQVHLANAPTFLKDDAHNLRQFIKQFVRYGDAGEVVRQLHDGKIAPSKSLADKLLSLLQGNKEFVMIDDQKIVYEEALSLLDKSVAGRKSVLMVEGGPGTGKSVVAINLLIEIIARTKLVKYVSKNAAPRTVYESKLTGTHTRTSISNLFGGSGAYIDSAANVFDALIVDEAHRLTEKSGLFENLGENQVKELISSSKLSVFFIDEDQRVTFKDIGTQKEIRKWADAFDADVHHLKLESQFRCNGSNGFLAWVDHILQIHDTANPNLNGVDYDFRVCTSAEELRGQIYQRNASTNRARMVAGYCWDWKSKNDPNAMDIQIGSSFEAKWNLSTDGNLWILKPNSVKEVGCIHTCQGLEVEYIGVIIGLDLIVRDGLVITNALERSRMDKSVRGYKTMLKKNPAQATGLADIVIKNTYRTLMTRGEKGCFVYSVDPETNEYLKQSCGRS